MFYKVPLLNGPSKGRHVMRSQRPLDGELIIVTLLVEPPIKNVYQYSQRRRGYIYIGELPNEYKEYYLQPIEE
jgi:hypothetical protein